MQKSSKLTVFASVVLSLVGILLLTSACNLFGQPTSTRPTNADILAPLPLTEGEPVKALLNTTVQIHSAHPGSNVSRVELWVKAPNQESGELIRSDVPENGIVLQKWVPQQPGVHTITLKTFDTNSDTPSEQVTTIRVLDSQEVSVIEERVQQEAAAADTQFVPPTPTPPAAPPVETAADAEIAVVSVEVESTAEATPVRRYPPPPPAPGVPHGPTQDQLSPFGPPVCNAAKFVDVYVSDTSKRVMITEPDDVPARVVGGTIVHRAWKLQNIGTCTWGPGYELAFYGGRSMGSGGVAFESFFPSEPGRRNAIINNNQLIAPEGKPNQTAVLEVLLTTPVTPGVHQSYWRMRNPHGVYFGPILGVTMEIVRDCTPGTYGAPVINKFEILGVGNVYRPTNPINVIATLGEAVTLEYGVINATNFDIVMTDPTGNIQSTSTPDPTGRVSFTPKTLGRHTITLYADNGSCTVTAEVFVDVIPPSGQQFQLDVILSEASSSTASADSHMSFSQAVPAGAAKVQWNHFDPEADQFTLVTGTYRRYLREVCPLFDWSGYCYDEWSDWELVNEISREVGAEAQGAAIVTNLEATLCSAASDLQEEYRTVYVMYAKKNGHPADPYESNRVVGQCVGTGGAPQLPVEIPAAGLE